jgi:hypothetical protein
LGDREEFFNLIMTGIIISSICGVVATGASSFITWFLSKKKYHSEVEGSNI